MKILLVTEQNEGGGAEAVVNQLAEVLNMRGHQVTMLCCRFTAASRIKGVNYIVAPVNPILQALALLKRWPAINRAINFIEYLVKRGPFSLYQAQLNQCLNQAIERLRPDVVHVHHFAGFCGLSATKKYRQPFVLTIHNVWPVCPSEFLLKGGTEPCQAECALNKPIAQACTQHQCLPNPITRQINVSRFKTLYEQKPFNGFQVITAPSQALCELLSQARITEDTQLCQLDNPISPRWLNQPKHIQASNKPYFLAVGQLYPNKGMHCLLDAFAKRPQYRLKIAGQGPAYALLAQRIRKEGLTNVELLGWQDKVSLRTLYQQSTALLLPSLWFETLGMVITESFAYAKPVIAFDVGGVSELVQHEKTGLLLPRGDIGELVTAMDRLIVNPELAKSLGLAGYELLHQRFNPEVVYEKTMMVYEAAGSSANQNRTRLKSRKDISEPNITEPSPV